MRTIRQRHQRGCAVAAIAMLSGRSYNGGFRMIHGNENRRNYSGTNFEKMLRTMFGLNLKQLRIHFDKSSFLKLENNALVSIHFKEYNTRHSVVWDASSKCIIDPLPEKYRTFTVTKRQVLERFAFAIEILP